MKKLLSVALGIVFSAAGACANDSGRIKDGKDDGVVSPETVTEKAESKYAECLSPAGGDRKAATACTAAYLKTIPGVKDVSVRGSDSLFVILTDGNEILLLLGRNRL
jgi:hypothetical protein